MAGFQVTLRGRIWVTAEAILYTSCCLVRLGARQKITIAKRGRLEFTYHNRVIDRGANIYWLFHGLLQLALDGPCFDDARVVFTDSFVTGWRDWSLDCLRPSVTKLQTPLLAEGADSLAACNARSDLVELDT